MQGVESVWVGERERERGKESKKMRKREYRGERDREKEVGSEPIEALKRLGQPW